MNILTPLFNAIDLLIFLLAIIITTMYKLVSYLISLIFPLFYNQIVQQHKNKDLPTHRKYYQIFVTLCFLSIAVRCVAFAGAIYTQNEAYQKWELFLAFMNRSGTVNYEVYICFAMLFIFLAYCHYLLYFSAACKLNWKFLYDLLVRNEVQFREQFKDVITQELFNFQQMKNLRYQRAISKIIKDSILLVVTLWKVADDDPKWIFKKNLIHFAFLGTRCRVRALMCLLVCEVVVSVAIFVIAFIFGIIFLFYLFLIIPKYSSRRAALISLDILFIGYLVFAIGKMLLSTLLSQLILSISVGWHLNEQNSVLYEQCVKVTQNRKLTVESRFQVHFAHFCWQHSCIVRFLYRYNHFHSYLALAFTVFNMPINTYLLAYLYYKSTLLDDNNIPIFAIFAIQLSVTIVYATSIIRMSNAVHGCRKVLPRAQMALGLGGNSQNIKGFCWALRWRFAMKYELLNVSHHKVTVRNGPFGEVTQRYMGSILKEYVEQLIYSIKLLDNKVLKW